MAEEYQSGYGKRPLWQWLLIYVVTGLIVYGLIYYFVLSRRQSDNYGTLPTPLPATNSEATASGEQTFEEDTIILSADGFSPATLSIKAGTKVTWTNQSGSNAVINSNPHPVHTDYTPFNLGNFPNGGVLSLTFDKIGTYGYHNHLNPAQIGAIIVQ